jgi:hypothetical protein
MPCSRTSRLAAAVALIVGATAASPVFAALEVVDSFYRPDRALPEFHYLWQSSFRFGNDPPNYQLSGALDTVDTEPVTRVGCFGISVLPSSTQIPKHH